MFNETKVKQTFRCTWDVCCCLFCFSCIECTIRERERCMYYIRKEKKKTRMIRFAYWRMEFSHTHTLHANSMVYVFGVKPEKSSLYLKVAQADCIETRKSKDKSVVNNNEQFPSRLCVGKNTMKIFFAAESAAPCIKCCRTAGKWVQMWKKYARVTRQIHTATHITQSEIKKKRWNCLGMQLWSWIYKMLERRNVEKRKRKIIKRHYVIAVNF